MRTEMYKALKERLLSIDEIKHVDLWNRNVEFIEEDTIWERPAVFVEFRPIQWNVLKEGKEYRADGTLVLHVVTDWTGDENDIDALDMSEKIQTALYGLEGDTFGRLILTESDTNHDHEQIVDNVEVYSYKAERKLLVNS